MKIPTVEDNFKEDRKAVKPLVMELGTKYSWIVISPCQNFSVMNNTENKWIP
jgi:hypothetical protein